MKIAARFNKINKRSIRFQYIVLASTVIIILMVGALLGSLYVKSTTDNNTKSLVLIDKITIQLNILRNAIWEADKALHEITNNSLKSNQQYILNKFNIVNELLEKFPAIKDESDNRMEEKIKRIHIIYQKINTEVATLLTLREDLNWLYPVIGIVNNTLLDANKDFDSSVQIAMSETISSGNYKYSSRIYKLLSEIHNAWQSMVLEFRSTLISFAGTNIRSIEQEKNIENYYQLIDEKLSELNKIDMSSGLMFESHTALKSMLASAKQWHEDYLQFLALRETNVWRADYQYIKTKIIPLQQEVFDLISQVEKIIADFSAGNTSRIENAATKITLELWMLCGISVLFVILIYLNLDKYLLSPIAQIARMISLQTASAEEISLPQKMSEEVHVLVNAFNTMRNQISHRQMVLEFQALHDSLTGLPNRALLQDRLEQALHTASRNNGQMALLLLDLDRFKDINDTLGHPVGDSVLRELSRRLEHFLRSSDTVARLGGDEFAIVTNYQDRKQIESFVDKIVKEIEKVIIVDERQLYIGVSIGVATYPLHGEDADTLIRHADIAMYSAKRENKDMEFYDDEKDYHSAESLELLSDLKTELKKPADQIQLHFQPIVDIASNQIAGAEALIRWIHPTQGMMSADHIIKMAEQTGLISDLTYWVLNESLRCFSKWGNESIRIAVNLSAINLHDSNLIPYISQKLEENNVSPERLTLEITESAVMNDPVMAQKVLTELKVMGVTLVIDDYGTGLSSLAYLKSFPVKCLKIDKSFVMEMLTNENDSIIIHSTIDMAHNLGLTVVAEGVENKKTFEILRNLKCDFAQGYYVAAPMSSDDLGDWIKNRSI